MRRGDKGVNGLDNQATKGEHFMHKVKPELNFFLAQSAIEDVYSRKSKINYKICVIAVKITSIPAGIPA